MKIIGAINYGRIADCGRGHRCEGIIPVVPAIPVIPASWSLQISAYSGLVLFGGSSFPVVLIFSGRSVDCCIAPA
jgi:hypothetical protein